VCAGDALLFTDWTGWLGTEK